jgi:predicted cupin superfamily sugar epimerase
VELQPGGPPKATVLGTDLAAGQVPQHVVPPGTWFGAAPCDGTEWALVGCTVAPGFEFSKFEMGEAGALLREFPQAAEWIGRLMAD